jgi:hypothetical protein
MQAITMGYGEYILFYPFSNEKQCDHALFNRVYPIFLEHRNGKEDRYEKILAEVQQLDSDLQIAFVPRTLYELVFKRKRLEAPPSSSLASKLPVIIGPEDHDKDVSIQELAYRTNEAAMEILAAEENFTLDDLIKQTENQIEFFNSFSKKSAWSNSFFDNKSKQIMINAVVLECSPLAHNHFLLYRGAQFSRDQPYRDTECNTLSYGSSLFAGFYHDKGAAPFYYMRHSDAFVIPVARDESDESPFYVAKGHPIAQLLGKGETFHARSKIWRGADLNLLNGILLGHMREDTIEHLVSDLSQEELIERVEVHYKSAISLIDNRSLLRENSADNF